MVNDRGARRARDTPASPGTAAADDLSILPSKGRQSFGHHAGAFARELLAVVIGAVIVASLLRGFVGQMFIIPSISMQNTLQIDDRVVVEKLSSVKRGQVVVFANPGGWLSGVQPTERGPVGRALEFVGVLPDTSTEHLIKRAVGMPGDHVVCCDTKGRITVNDVPLDESTYLFRSPGGVVADPSQIRFDVVVPADRIFVLGDNRGSSRDSRCHLNDTGAGAMKGENAFVPLDLVVGRAVAVAWPVGDAHRLTVPATYAGVPVPVEPAPLRPVVRAGPEASC
ncbi:signal peptidase I [Microlunatus aurantiacus]|uniref:signal peptidase I n=1 Tax=Microlunatus aurantiacus TaxID=446786 RepID=UPI0031DD09B6